MDDDEVIAERTRRKWNAIHTAAIRYAEWIPDEGMEQDCVWRCLGRVPYPWLVGVAPQVGIGLCKVSFVGFQFKPEPDRKKMSIFVSIMAQLLREESKCHVVIVLDSTHQYGFSVQHDGADDMTIQELFPGTIQ